MNDKDTKLIYEAYLKEDSGCKGPPLTVLGSTDDEVDAAKANPGKYMYSVEYPGHWDEDRCKREIGTEYEDAIPVGDEPGAWKYNEG